MDCSWASENLAEAGAEPPEHARWVRSDGRHRLTGQESDQPHEALPRRGLRAIRMASKTLVGKLPAIGRTGTGGGARAQAQAQAEEEEDQEED